ncbi:MAG: hypothetical protein Q7S61_05175 [bacterium]|nr:hypothetical protein [bacterium]
MPERKSLLPVPDVKSLKELLISYLGLATLERWDTGSAKGIEKLYEEIQEGESKLYLHKSKGKKELLRQVRKASIDLYGIDRDDKEYKLVEIAQSWTNGRIVDRREKQHSLTEKMKPREQPSETLKRALQEELHLPEEILRKLNLSKNKYLRKREISPSESSFPNLLNDKTEFHFNRLTFRLNLGGELLYTGNDKGKILAFAWMPLSLNEEEQTKFKNAQYERFIEGVKKLEGKTSTSPSS